MRRVDLWLIPWLCLLYLLSFLDRTNIGNARLAGMEDDLDMGKNATKPTLLGLIADSSARRPRL